MDFDAKKSQFFSPTDILKWQDQEKTIKNGFYPIRRAG